jgi:hypothetical protein
LTLKEPMQDFFKKVNSLLESIKGSSQVNEITDIIVFTLMYRPKNWIILFVSHVEADYII